VFSRRKPSAQHCSGKSPLYLSGLDQANIVFANEYSEPIADHFSAQKRC
jgi:hypothetical protein